MVLRPFRHHFLNLFEFALDFFNMVELVLSLFKYLRRMCVFDIFDIKQ